MDVNKRSKRIQKYTVFSLQRRVAELSALVEASLIEGGNLLSQRQKGPPSNVELTDEDLHALSANRAHRHADIIHKHCAAVLKTVAGHKWAFPFLHPVDLVRYPDYSTIVHQPMDLGTVKTRMEQGAYTHPREVLADVQLVFQNACRYNPPGSDCYLMAQTLQELAVERWEKLVAPRIADESAAAHKEEAAALARRQEAVRLSRESFLERGGKALLGVIDELLAAVADAKSSSAALCTPLTPAEMTQLAAQLAALPPQAFAGCAALLASRCRPSVEVRPAPHDEQTEKGRVNVSLDLGSCDAVTLRAVTHVVASVRSSSSSSTSATPPPTDPGSTSTPVSCVSKTLKGPLPAASGGGLSRACNISWPGLAVGAGARPASRSNAASVRPPSPPGPVPNGLHTSKEEQARASAPGEMLLSTTELPAAAHAPQLHAAAQRLVIEVPAVLDPDDEPLVLETGTAMESDVLLAELMSEPISITEAGGGECMSNGGVS